MAAITWDDVTGTPPALGFAPELVAFDDAIGRALILELVNTTGISVKNFGGEEAAKTRIARILLAAHFATMLRRRGIGGAVASQSEGGVSESMSNILIGPRALDQTSYGQLLHTLTMGTPARAGLLA